MRNLEFIDSTRQGDITSVIYALEKGADVNFKNDK